MKTQSFYHLKQLFNNVKKDYTYLQLIPQTTANKVEHEISKSTNHFHSICLALKYSYVLMFDDNYLLVSVINHNSNRITTLLYLKDDLNIL